MPVKTGVFWYDYSFFAHTLGHESQLYRLYRYRRMIWHTRPHLRAV